jgi:hypothetical protein
MQHHETVKQVGDALSLGVVVGTIAAWLPAIAAFFSIIWTLIRIYETKTFQKIISWWRNR